jgi:hypothetical protein
MVRFKILDSTKDAAMKIEYKHYIRRHILAILLAVTVISVGVMVYAKSSSFPQGPYGLAGDFPRGPMVYAQFENLPALVKQWNDSKLKEQYLESTNFKQFANHHLAIKLLARWQEFNDATGFPLDATAIAEPADGKVGIAAYDLGRLDIVLIAPASEAKFAASKFFQGKDQFDEKDLGDGTVYYTHQVEADRGRQKQEIAFAMLKGRFVLASSEKLLLRTLANINHKSSKDALVDDPSFKTLSDEVKPHFATVWVDQAKLNSDWYFKHYWLMSSVTDLKRIRAGIIDLEMLEGKVVEHRDFLTDDKGTTSGSAVPLQDVNRLSALIPDDLPYLKISSLGEDGSAAATLVHDTILDGPRSDGKQRKRTWRWQSYRDTDFSDDDGGADYTYLGRKYDSTIDDPSDAKVADDEQDESRLASDVDKRVSDELRQALTPAAPRFAAIAESPQSLKGPLFAEFRKAAVLTLQSPSSLDRQAFERAVSSAAQSRLMIAVPAANLLWVNGASESRELEVPTLGWKLCYAVRGQELIVTNSSEMLQSILAAEKKRPSKTDSTSPLDELTVVRFDHRDEAFDHIVGKLDEEKVKAYWERRKKEDKSDKNGTDKTEGGSDKPDDGSDKAEGASDKTEGASDKTVGASEEFFSGNVVSLLNVASRVKEIQIKRTSQPGHLREEVDITLK